MLFRDNWATAVYRIFIFYPMDLAAVHLDQSAPLLSSSEVGGVMSSLVGGPEHLAVASCAIGGGGRRAQPRGRL